MLLVSQRVLRGVVLATCVTLPAGAPAVRDSAGASLWTYGRDARAPRTWALIGPRVELGGATGAGPTEFSTIYGAVRFGDGGIAVANTGSNEIRLFNRVGAFVRSLGRHGAGPGEFEYLWSLERLADTLIGVDAAGRAQVFAPDGTLLRSLPRPLVRRGVGPRRAGFLSDGSAVVYARDQEPSASDGDALIWYTVERQPVSQGDTAELFRVPARPRASRLPMFSPAGSVTASGDRVCAGYTATFEISCHDATGKLRFRVKRDVVPRPIGDADRQYLRDAHVAANPGVRRERLDQEAAAFTFAAQAPAFGALMLSTAGELWVSEFHRTVGRSGPGATIAPREPVRWSVFGRDGRWMADIALPARFVPYEAGSDYVIGVTFGEDDEERVTVWGIRR